MALKTSNGIFETSSEELRNLSKKKGLAQPPGSPLESSVVGGNPDQSKMSGTPEQVRATAREQLEGPDSLQTAQRQAQPRKQANAAEQGQIDQAQALQGLGSLDSRVQQLAVKQLQPAPGEGATLQIDTSKIPAGLDETGRGEFEAALQKVASGQATPQDILKINQLLGKENVSDALSAEEIKALFTDSTAAIGQALAQQVPDSFTLGELNPAELGFTDWADMAQKLAVSPEELQGMNIPAFTELIQKKRRADFANADQYRAILADPTAPAAEREEAKRILREMGATGVRQAEDSVEKLASEIEAGNTVEFMGRQMTIEELLKDETVSAIAKEYFENPEAAAALRQEHQELATWFDDNAKALKEAAKAVDKQTADFQKIQEANQQVGKWKDVGLSEATLETLFPDWGKLSATAREVPPLLQQLGKADPEIRASTVNLMDNLAGINPDFARELAGKSIEELARYGAFDPNKQQAITQFAKEAALVKSKTAEKDPWIFINQVFGGADEKKLQAELSKLRAYERYGVGGGAGASTLRLLDADQDGKLDDPKVIAKRLAASTQGKSFTDILTGAASSAGSGIQKSRAKLDSTIAKSSSVDQLLSQAIADGGLSSSELAQIGGEFAKGNDLGSLRALESKLGGSQKQKITELISKSEDNIAKEIFAASGIGGDFADSVSKPQDIQAALDKLRTAMAQMRERGVTNPNVNGGFVHKLRVDLETKLKYVKMSEAERARMRKQMNEMLQLSGLPKMGGV